MPNPDAPRFEPDDASHWRAWLEASHASTPAVWLVYRKTGHQPNLKWSDAVDEALCYGWIDSVVHAIDDARYEQWFCPRKPTSAWSRINKAKIEALREAGRMRPAGLAAVELAVANGSWTILDGPEALEVPDDLGAAMAAAPGALERFRAQPASTQRYALQSLVMAKREATRAKRIQAIVEEVGGGPPAG